MITFLTGKTNFGKKWKQESSTVQSLYARFKTPKLLKDKNKADWIVFASAKTRERNIQSLDKFYGAILDVDGSGYTMKQLSKKLPWSHLMHTTYSHKVKPKNNFHIIIPFKKPVSKSTYGKVVKYIVSLFPDDSKVDAVSHKDLQIMYMPSCHPDNALHYRTLVKRRPVYFEVTPEIKFALEEMEDSVQYEESTFDISSMPTEGNRNEYFNRMTGKFINVGFSRNQAMDVAMALNSTLDRPLSKREIKTTVNSTYKTHQRSNKDAGWGFDELMDRVSIAKDYEKGVELISSSFDKLKKFELDKLIVKLAEQLDERVATVKQDVMMNIGLSDDMDDWVYLMKDHVLFNTRISDTVKIDAFNNITQGSSKKFKSLIALGKLKVADKFQFNPAEELIYLQERVLFVNTYRAPDLMPKEGDVSIMLAHFEYMLSDEHERNIILDYIAFLVQKPGIKVRWMPVIKGRSGIGKSTLVHAFITPILGIHNVHNIDNNSMVGGSFNAWQLDCQLIVFHELQLGTTQKEKKMLTESLKSFITDEHFMAHRKGVDEYQVENHANSFAFTNAEDSIAIDEDERRYCMIRSEAEPMPEDYYEELRNWSKENVDVMYHYFKNRDLTFFTPNTLPETKYTHQVKSQSYMWPKSVLLACIQDKDHILHSSPVVSLAYLYRLVQHESNGTRDAERATGLGKRGNNQNTMFIKDLEALGFRKLDGPKGAVRIYDKRTGKQEIIYKTPRSKNDDIKLTEAKRIVLETELPEQEFWD